VKNKSMHVISINYNRHYIQLADPSGRAFKGVGLLPLACWDCGFESHNRFGCLFLVRVVRRQLEVFVSGYHFVQRILTECGVSECDCEI